MRKGQYRGIHRSLPAQAAVIIAAAFLCAGLANFLAPPKRRLAWLGDYPRALTLPSQAAEVPSKQATSEAAVPSRSDAIIIAPSSRNPVVETPAPSVPATVRRRAASPARTGPRPPASPNRAAATAAPPPLKTFPPHPDRPWLEITGEDAWLLYQRGALFFDARRTDVYIEGHIPRARSIAVWESDAADKVAALYREGLDLNQPIVVYCSGGNCEDSHMLAEKLYGIGLDNVLVYKDGFPDWQKGGRPVERGAPK